jgi:Rab-3A-interacting protein
MNDTYSSTSVTTTQSTSSTNTSNRSFLNTSICDDYACTLDYQKRRSRSLVCVRSHNHYYNRLKEEIDHLKCLLKEKNDIIVKLVDIREKLESEVRELSASLFEQAYKMVNTAKEETAQTNKLLVEANNKVDILEAEVKALKELVITSTPSTPNRHLHPQLNKSTSFNNNQALLLSTIVTTPKISHRRTSSSNDAQLKQAAKKATLNDEKSIYEIDPIYFKEMAEWLCEMNNNNLPFINRILTEDILPCMNFSNKQVSTFLSI